MPGEPSGVAKPAASQRDPAELAGALAAWLSGQAGAGVTVTDVQVPDSNGMSCETVLFDASWDGAVHELVAKIAPQPSAVPVFPSYDMGRQFQVMQAVRASSAVPVPEVLWLHEDDDVLGVPFFVMRRLSGQVPPDVMPYNFGSWVTDASDAELARLQESSVGVLAALHAIPAQAFAFLGPAGLSAHVAQQRSFYDWVCGGAHARSPLIEQAFAWLIEHWPASEGEAALSWGDARIGNIMYQDFSPAAVLDWEMAALAPREVDLGWFIFLHRFFEDIAAGFELPAMPDFLRRQDVCRSYEQLTGYSLRDLDFYLVYAALRHAIIMFRIQCRAIHFGEAVAPADPDEMIMHHKALRSMLDGTYWSGVS